MNTWSSYNTTWSSLNTTGKVEKICQANWFSCERYSREPQLKFAVLGKYVNCESSFFDAEPYDPNLRIWNENTTWDITHICKEKFATSRVFLFCVLSNDLVSWLLAKLQISGANYSKDIKMYHWVWRSSFRIANQSHIG